MSACSPYRRTDPDGIIEQHIASHPELKPDAHPAPSTGGEVPPGYLTPEQHAEIRAANAPYRTPITRATPDRAPGLREAVTNEDVARAICDYNGWAYEEMQAAATTSVTFCDTRAVSLRRVLEAFALRAALRDGAR